jgi:hypothetical protein
MKKKLGCKDVEMHNNLSINFCFICSGEGFEKGFQTT